MNRDAALTLDALRLRLEAHSKYDIDDKYVGPEFIPADKLPTGPKTNWSNTLFQATLGIHAFPSNIDILSDGLEKYQGIAEHYLNTLRQMRKREGLPAYVDKALGALQSEFENTVKSLASLVKDLQRSKAPLKKATDDLDREQNAPRSPK